MKKTLLISILILSILFLFACKKESSPAAYNLSGEFAKKDGTCTPFCLISISGDILTLKGTDFAGSTLVRYQEQYQRSSTDINKYTISGNPAVYITAISNTSFTFKSDIRNCTFSQ